ncbi:integration host factor, actinobacterial type [Arthrobacter sp. GMC3]|uniref:integration host factor, actinobacterial type n=1 Tax=Arthrobacter sp. GMC3 TaxID=2058894 RepID=UPI000CE48F6F|nr:integration host factor, actinobacterial type [Arthrobacter sp. GMC3]
MSLPSLSDQERAEALKKAAAARTVRSQIKADLKSGAVSVAAVISAAADDPALGRLKVTELLEALPGIGKVRATVIMSELGISPTRRVRGLGIHQRRSLVDFLGQAHFLGHAL